MDCKMCSKVVFAVTVCLSVVFSAPVDREVPDLEETESLSSQVQDQELDLEKLAQLAAQSRSNGIEYQKSHSYSYTDINGAKDKQEHDEEKVLDPKTESVISDVKEQLAQSQQSSESRPVTSYKATVDVPEAGIHKEISDSGESDTSSSGKSVVVDPEESMDFTPRRVASYILQTGQIQEFEETMRELVDTKQLTQEEADEYQKNVWNEYFDLVEQQAVQDRELPYESEFYPGGEFQEGPMRQGEYPYNQISEDIYPLYGIEAPKNGGYYPDDAEYVPNRPVTLDEMINTLLDEWLTDALLTGNPQAGEIIRKVQALVAQDGNANDAEQIQAVLTDLFADALLQDLSPRITPVQEEEEPQPQQAQAAPEDAAQQLEEIASKDLQEKESSKESTEIKETKTSSEEEKSSVEEMA